MTQYLHPFVASAIVLAISGHLAWCQTDRKSSENTIDGIESVPEDLRAAFLSETTHFVEDYVAGEWQAVYPKLMPRMRVEDSLAEFLSNRDEAYPINKGERLLSLVPESVVETPSTNWAVAGCATIERPSGARIREEWILLVFWEQDGWYFTEPSPNVGVDATEAGPCRSEQSSSNR